MRWKTCVLAVALAAEGCAIPHDRLLFLEESHVGLIVKVSPSDAAAPADIDFGYRRSILTLTPQKNADLDTSVVQPKDYDYGEPLSVISAFRAKVGWFSNTEVHTYFATGRAATNTAGDEDAIKQLMAPTGDIKP